MKDHYFIKIRKCTAGWLWYIHGANGKMISKSKIYRNKTQCSNVAQKFAYRAGLLCEVKK